MTKFYDKNFNRNFFFLPHKSKHKKFNKLGLWLCTQRDTVRRFGRFRVDSLIKFSLMNYDHIK